VQIRIATRHGNLSGETQEKIRTKAERLLRIFERLTSIEITIDLEHEERPGVEFVVSAEHKHDFVATSATEDLMVSVDQVIHKLESQLRKYKEKIQDHHG